MKKIMMLTVVTVILLLGVGCAGTRFTRIPDTQLNLGHDTMQSVCSRLGKPRLEGTLIKNGQTIKTIEFSSGKLSFQAAFGGPLPYTAQAFYFYNNVLVGHIYSSTVSRDKTNFDSSKVEKIKENETKINEVLALLGPPSGEYVYPMIAGKNDKAKVYFYAQAKMGFLKSSEYRQILIISYNPEGIVTKLEFVEAGVK